MMTQAYKQHGMSPRQAVDCCRPVDERLDTDLFKALCDPTRASLVRCLLKCARPCSVTEVAECCSVDFSVVSRHLAQLEKVGVLEMTKEGRTTYYRARHAHLAGLLRGLADAIDECCTPDAGSGGKGACGCVT